MKEKWGLLQKEVWCLTELKGKESKESFQGAGAEGKADGMPPPPQYIWYSAFSFLIFF